MTIQRGLLRVCAPAPRFSYWLGRDGRSAAATAVVTATAGEQDDRKDDQPYPVVVEEIAETVVHNRFLLEYFERRSQRCPREPPFCYQNMRKDRKCSWVLSKKFGWDRLSSKSQRKTNVVEFSGAATLENLRQYLRFSQKFPHKNNSKNNSIKIKQSFQTGRCC